VVVFESIRKEHPQQCTQLSLHASTQTNTYKPHKTATLKDKKSFSRKHRRHICPTTSHNAFLTLEIATRYHHPRKITTSSSSSHHTSGLSFSKTLRPFFHSAILSQCLVLLCSGTYMVRLPSSTPFLEIDVNSCYCVCNRKIWCLGACLVGC